MYESNERHRPYRARNGMILGVCQGISNYTEISVGWIRFFSLLVMFITGLWPIVGLYFIAGLLMKPEPILPLETPEDRDFYDSYVSSSRSETIRKLRNASARLEKRIRNIENIVTTKEREHDWDRRFNESR